METDFISLTTEHPDLGTELFSIVGMKADGSPRYRRLMGAEGYEADRVFVGRWPNGRWIATAAGSRSGVVWETLTSREFDLRDISVSRVDLQVTLLVHDADELIFDLEPNPRFKGTRIIPTKDRGTTLYVGSTKSDKRIRLYNKSVQAGLEAAVGEYLRVEAQLRDTYGDLALAVARANGKRGLYSWWRELCVHMVPGIAGLLPPTSAAHVSVPPERETVKRYALWVEKCVLPALEKAQLTDEWEGIKGKLLSVLEEKPKELED